MPSWPRRFVNIRVRIAFCSRREVEYAATKQLLGDEPDYAIGVQDAKKITDANILVRGEQKQLGELAETWISVRDR